MTTKANDPAQNKVVYAKDEELRCRSVSSAGNALAGILADKNTEIERLRAQTHADGNEIGTLTLKVMNLEKELAAERERREKLEADAIDFHVFAAMMKLERDAALEKVAKLREALEDDRWSPMMLLENALAVLAETGGGNE